MKLTINFDPSVVGGIMRYANDKCITLDSACCYLIIRALAHFGYL